MPEQPDGGNHFSVPLTSTTFPAAVGVFICARHPERFPPFETIVNRPSLSYLTSSALPRLRRMHCGTYYLKLEVGECA